MPRKHLTPKADRATAAAAAACLPFLGLPGVGGG